MLNVHLCYNCKLISLHIKINDTLENRHSVAFCIFDFSIIDIIVIIESTEVDFVLLNTRNNDFISIVLFKCIKNIQYYLIMKVSGEIISCFRLNKS